MAQRDERRELFGDRDDVYDTSSRRVGGDDEDLFDDGRADEQRTRLLSGTERLERSSDRLRNSQRIANETEGIGATILGDLHGQREQILHARDEVFQCVFVTRLTRLQLLRADGYVDRSVRTIKGMARR